MKEKLCKHFKQITSENGDMIFGCICLKHDKSVFYYECKECKDFEERK